MSIDLCITDRATGESRFHPVCSADRFRTDWQPAAYELGLEMVALLDVLTVTTKFLGQLTAELSQLRDFVSARPDNGYRAAMIATIDEILELLRNTSLTAHDLSFG